MGLNHGAEPQGASVSMVEKAGAVKAVGGGGRRVTGRKSVKQVLVDQCPLS